MPTYHVHVFASPPPPPEHSDTRLLALRGLQFLSSAIVTVLAVATIHEWDADADRPATAIEMPTLAAYSALAGIFGMMVSLEGSITLVWDSMHCIPCINLDAMSTAMFFAGGSALAYLWRVNEENPSNDWCHQLDDHEHVVYDRCDHFEAQIMGSAFFQLIAFTVSLLLTFLAIARRRERTARVYCEEAATTVRVRAGAKVADERSWLLQDATSVGSKQQVQMKHWMKLCS